jgi:L-2-hydroxyglutarate oxidase
MLRRRGVSGVRTSVVNASGFVPEALLIEGEGSAHIINYNSPGATGAPAYSAWVVASLSERGLLGGFTKREGQNTLQGWDFWSTVNQL